MGQSLPDFPWSPTARTTWRCAVRGARPAHAALRQGCTSRRRIALSCRAGDCARASNGWARAVTSLTALNVAGPSPATVSSACQRRQLSNTVQCASTRRLRRQSTGVESPKSPRVLHEAWPLPTPPTSVGSCSARRPRAHPSQIGHIAAEPSMAGRQGLIVSRFACRQP